jgi:uncharacterized protein YigE (DUF2233 family)
MKTSGLILLLYLFSSVCNGQTSGDNQLNFGGHSYGVFIIKVDTASVKRFKLVQNLTGIPHNDFIRPYITDDPNMFITNASVWDSVFQPVGLFISGGKTINPINLSDGNQMGFYLKPNGVFIVTDKEATVVESSKAVQYANPRVAVQSGPMLVIDGKIHPKFDPSSKNKNYRCGVGIFENNGAKYLVFAASNEPVTLYDFASLFKDKYKCNNSLCLQSAGCAMYSPYIDRKNAIENRAIGNYIMFSNHY